MPPDRPLLVLGTAIDQQTLDALTRVDRIPQVQTFRLQWAIIHAVERALGRTVDVLATVPTRDWPFTRKLLFRGRRGQRAEVRDQRSEVRGQAARDQKAEAGGRKAEEESEAGTEKSEPLSTCRSPLSALRSSSWVQMPMVNLLGLKQLSRAVTASWYLTKWLLRNRRQRPVIVSYGVIVPHLLPAAVLKRCFGARLVAILTDAPLTYHDEPALYRAARWLDRRLLRLALGQLDGVIALTGPLAERFAPRAPACIMEGIVSDDAAAFADQKPEVRGQRSEVRSEKSESLSTVHCPLSTHASPPKSFTVMYAGQLHADYGVKVLVDAFRSLPDASYRLVLYGQGTLEDEIRLASRSDPRITYHGFQPADVIFPAMRQADLMVVPRFPDDHMAAYSFPSKLLEYMAMGRIVVCAKLPSIPADYYPHLALVDNMTAPELAKRIQEVASVLPADREQMESEIRQFIWGEKTQLQQGRRLVEFLETVRAAN